MSTQIMEEPSVIFPKL